MRKLNVVSPCQHAPIVNAHAQFEIDIVSSIPLVSNQVNAAVGTGKHVQLDQIARALEKGGRPQMPQDLANASLIFNLLETPNEGTVRAPLMTK